MNVTIGKKGELDLEALFTKAFVKKIFSYGIEKDESSGSIRIWFFGAKGIPLKPKLKKNGKAKKG